MHNSQYAATKLNKQNHNLPISKAGNVSKCNVIILFANIKMLMIWF